jgi:hypothetical protein
VVNENGIRTVLDMLDNREMMETSIKKIYELVKRYYSERILSTERGRLVNENEVGCDPYCK